MSVLEKFKLVELITTRTDAVVTFVSGNIIRFNAATHVDLGYPEAIQLFVDEKGKQFAIKACKESDPEAIKFSRPAGEVRHQDHVRSRCLCGSPHHGVGCQPEYECPRCDLPG